MNGKWTKMVVVINLCVEYDIAGYTLGVFIHHTVHHSDIGLGLGWLCACNLPESIHDGVKSASAGLIFRTKILLQDLFQRWNMGPMVISRVWYSITFQLAQFKWCMHTTFKSDCHPLNCHAFGKLQPSICRSFSSGNCWFSTLILIYWRAYPFISLTYWPSTAGRSI